MTPEEKLQFLGEQLFEEVERVNKLIKLVSGIYNDLTELLARTWQLNYNKSHLDNRLNELTHLHNEMTEVQKLLGLDGSVPKIKVRQSRY